MLLRTCVQRVVCYIINVCDSSTVHPPRHPPGGRKRRHPFLHSICCFPCGSTLWMALLISRNICVVLMCISSKVGSGILLHSSGLLMLVEFQRIQLSDGSSCTSISCTYCGGTYQPIIASDQISYYSHLPSCTGTSPYLMHCALLPETLWCSRSDVKYS